MKTRRYFLSRMSWLTVGISIATVTRSALAVAAAKVVEKFKGVAYYKGDNAYERKRTSLVWQAIKPPRYPNRIFEVTSEEDILAALTEARDADLPVSIVCGGHSYVANGVQDNAILLDISRLRDVEIDATNRVARVQPGVRSSEFDYLLRRENLAFPVPHSPTVALGGYLLGGGMGWNAESWNNLACFNIRAVEVILASGEKVTASADQHPDLFWAACGGGPIFCGIVTHFHLNIFPRPAAIRESTYIYTIDAIDPVITWLEKARAVQDSKVELSLTFITAEPTEKSGEADKQCIASVLCFADDEEEAKALIAPITKDAPTEGILFKDELAPKTMNQLLATASASIPYRHAVETFWTDDVAEATKRVGHKFLSTPSAQTLVYINYRSNPTLPRDAAYSVIGEAFIYSAVAWAKPEQDKANIQWSDNLVTSLEPFDKAAYINETEFVRHPERARHCFSDAHWQKLKLIAAKYDPTGMFLSPFI